MIRRSKTFVAIAAVLAFAAITASSASAEFHTSVEHPILSAAQVESVQFSAATGLGAIACTTADLSGTASAKTNTTLTFSPAYSGCKDSLGRTVDVSVNECKFVLHPGEASGGTATGSMAIECPAGKALTTLATGGPGNCTTTFPSQTGIKTIHYEDSGSDVKVKFQVNNLKLTLAGGGFACGTAVTQSSTGMIVGSMTLTAANTAGSGATISISGEVPSPVFEVTSTYTSKEGAHGHTTFSADQTTPYAFTPAGGAPSVSCEEVSYEGTSETGKDSAIVVSPSYVGCEDSLGRKADIEANGCLYELAPGEEVSSGTFKGTADIECGAKPIEIKITSAKEEVLCTTTIGSQSKVGPVHFTNMTATAPTNLTIGFEAANVTNTTSGGSEKCGVADGAHQGSYKGGSELDGESCIPADVAVAKE